MPQLADPSNIRSRPASATLGQPAIAAGVVGHSVTFASDFPANVKSQVWRHHAQSLGAESVTRARTKNDIKPLLEGPVQKIRSGKSEKIFWFFVLVLLLVLLLRVEDEEEDEDESYLQLEVHFAKQKANRSVHLAADYGGVARSPQICAQRTRTCTTLRIVPR